MTTKVTIDAHAGWPVQVQINDEPQDGSVDMRIETVSPGTVREFYVHSTRHLVVREMRKET